MTLGLKQLLNPCDYLVCSCQNVLGGVRQSSNRCINWIYAYFNCLLPSDCVVCSIKGCDSESTSIVSHLLAKHIKQDNDESHCCLSSKDWQPECKCFSESHPLDRKSTRLNS